MKLGQLTGFFALVVSLYILWQIRQVVLLVFAAVVLATVLNRVVARLEQYIFSYSTTDCHPDLA